MDRQERKQRLELQIKVKGDLSHDLIASAGGNHVGEVCQKDYYLRWNPILCLRHSGEDGEWLLSERTPTTVEADTGIRKRECIDQVQTEQQARELLRKFPPHVVVSKTRTSYQLDGVLITVDQVDECGTYVELHGTDAAALDKALKILGLEGRPPILKSYYEIMLEEKIPFFRRKILLIHERLGLLAVGIVGGVLTPAAALIGAACSGAPRMGVAAMVAVVAYCDSLSDGIGVYEGKIRERTTTRQTALRYAGGTIIGKVLVPSSMIVFLLLLPWPWAIYAALGWGVLIFALFTAELAYVERTSIPGALVRKLPIALFIVLFSFTVCWLSQRYVE